MLPDVVPVENLMSPLDAEMFALSEASIEIDAPVMESAAAASTDTPPPERKATSLVAPTVTSRPAVKVTSPASETRPTPALPLSVAFPVADI